MAGSRERGTGSVYLKEDPNNYGQKLQTWWFFLLHRMGEHVLGLELGGERSGLPSRTSKRGFRRGYGPAPSPPTRWRRSGQTAPQCKTGTRDRRFLKTLIDSYRPLGLSPGRARSLSRRVLGDHPEVV
jgi:hypothetical protein